MEKILIILAHPAIHKSRVNRELILAVSDLENVYINDLYENYPDFFINVKREQELLQEHDIIVWHHPLYWYSCPAILKEWMDLVLEHDFAYGRRGTRLHGKKVLNAITTGGSAEVYSEKGKNHFTIHQFLVPFLQTANLCGMLYLAPFVIHGAHMLNKRGVDFYAQKYKKAIISLRDGKFSAQQLFTTSYLNDLT
jgi:glutathione-regulated potassium-efflux system ancillary protein KefG